MTFFQSPLKLGIVLGSFILSIIALTLLLKKDWSSNKKLMLIYSHIFFLVFPFVFYTLFRGCVTMFQSCSKIVPIAILLGISGGASLIIGLLVAPLLFIKKYQSKSIVMKNGHLISFMNNIVKKFNIYKPILYIIDTAKPIAFSLSIVKKKIFISIGLTDLLTKKEMEAVLLHELGHIRDKSSTLKFSTLLMKHLSPLSMFTPLIEELNHEEIKADIFAIKTQRTDQYLKSAKKKINSWRIYQDKYS